MGELSTARSNHNALQHFPLCLKTCKIQGTEGTEGTHNKNIYINQWIYLVTLGVPPVPPCRIKPTNAAVLVQHLNTKHFISKLLIASNKVTSIKTLDIK